MLVINEKSVDTLADFRFYVKSAVLANYNIEEKNCFPESPKIVSKSKMIEIGSKVI